MIKMTCKINLTIVIKVVDLNTSHIYSRNHMVGMDKTFSNEFPNLVACWWHTRTYHLNMVTINRISLIMWQHRPIFPKKNPLYHPQSLFFCHQDMKFCLKNIHWLLVCNGFSLKSTFLCDLNPNLAKSSCGWLLVHRLHEIEKNTCILHKLSYQHI
jgi:hypothetical protein